MNNEDTNKKAPAAIRFAPGKAHIHHRFMTVLNEVSKQRGGRVYAVDFVAELLDHWNRVQVIGSTITINPKPVSLKAYAADAEKNDPQYLDGSQNETE